MSCCGKAGNGRLRERGAKEQYRRSDRPTLPTEVPVKLTMFITHPAFPGDFQTFAVDFPSVKGVANWLMNEKTGGLTMSLT